MQEATYNMTRAHIRMVAVLFTIQAVKRRKSDENFSLSVLLVIAMYM